MNVYHRRFGWNKAFITVFAVALILYILDAGIQLHLHSDLTANLGPHPPLPAATQQPGHNGDEAPENQAHDQVAQRPQNRRPVRMQEMDEDEAEELKRKRQQAPFRMPDNPFLDARAGVDKKQPLRADKDVGFRRDVQGKLVFAPDAMVKDLFAKEEQEDNKQMIPPRDPRKKKGKKNKEAPESEENGIVLTGLTDEEKEAKKTRQTLLDRLETLYGEVKKAKGFDDLGNFESQGYDEPTQCVEMTRPGEDDIEIANEQWQIMDGLQHDVFLHTAYLDARPAFDDTPSIRTMLVISGYFFHGRPHCLFWYNGQNAPINVPTTSINRLSMLRKHFVNNVQYSMYMFSCKIPEGMETPDEISMVMNPCESPSNILPVVRPYDDTTKHDFAVCVIGQWAQIGDIEAAFLTEWIEAYTMFGVGEINIYNVSLKVTPMVQKVIDHYTDAGKLRIIHHTSPVTATDPNDEYDASQLCLRTTANDCLIRNNLRYKHIFVIDRDEIMVPRKHKTYREMANYWFENFEDFDIAPAITVQNSFFYMDFDPDLEQPPYLATMRYRSRQPPDMPNPEHKYIPGKSMVNTQHCKIVWNHNCQIPMEPKQLAPLSTALLQHYRRGCLIASRVKDKGIKEHECEWIRYREAPDDYMLKYRQPLQERVDNAFRDIGVNVTYLTDLLNKRTDEEKK